MKKLFLLLPWVLLLLCCTGNESSPVFQEAGGPGSETTNGIVARVDGMPAAFAGVALRRVDQKAATAAQENAVIQPDIYADSNGVFVLDSIEDKSKTYRMTVVRNGAAFSKTLTGEEISEMDSVDLLATGSVVGSVNVPKGSEFAWVGVYGMDVLVKTDSEGHFSMPQLPSGDSLELYFVEQKFDSVFSEHDVLVKAFAVENVDLSEEDDEGIVAIANGKPVPYATVALRKADMVQDSPVVMNFMVAADKYTDSKGRFTLDVPDSGEYRLTIIGVGTAYSKVLSVKELAKLDTVKLIGTGSLVGNVTLKSEMKFAYVGIQGLDVLIKSDENGNYVFPSLPVDDSLSFYFADKNMDKLHAETKAVVNEYTAEFHAPSMLLQDFESDDYSLWYVNTDSLGSTMTPKKKVEDGIEYDSTRKSNVFHASYSLVPFESYAWALVGMTLWNASWNMSQLDSIAFYAKGNGKIRVAVENWDKMSEELGMNLKAASEWIDLDPKTWTRIVVRPVDLSMNAADYWDGSRPWNSVKSFVKQINFFANGGSDFYIDNIWLYGALF